MTFYWVFMEKTKLYNNYNINHEDGSSQASYYEFVIDNIFVNFGNNDSI